MTKKVKCKKEENLTEEQQWYRMKMARYYEEEWDKLFKQQHEHSKKRILFEPNDRVTELFVKQVIKNAESRDWEDDNPQN